MREKQKNKIIEDIESLLPKKIRNFAEKITVYSFLPELTKDYYHNAFCYYYSKKHKSAIFIFPVFWRFKRDKQIKVIFHEIAHVYLHFHNMKNNEREANKLAKGWLMTSNS